MEMKPEIKTQWITALRSGDYKQGKGVLKKGDKYCCLGVLSDLAVKAGIGRWEDSPYRDGVSHVSASGAYYNSYLPYSVRLWAGLDSPEGVRLDSQDSRSLIALNDMHGFTFSEIADVIEREF